MKLETLRLIEAVIATHENRVSTHYEGCYAYHAGCLANLILHIEKEN